MAMKLKAGADLCDMQILNFCIHNAQNDKSAAPVGYKYLNTLSSNTNAYLRERIYVGGNVTTDGWRTAAYLDDLDKLDVASNEDFKALKEKVELLAGDTDTDTIISNMKEVSAFLSGFAEDASLMDLLNSKLDKTGGTINGNLTITTGIDRKLILNNYGSDTYNLISFQQDEVEIGWLGILDGTNIAWAGKTLLHLGNIGNYTLFKKLPTLLTSSDDFNNCKSGYFGWKNADTPANGTGANTAALALTNVRSTESFQLVFDANTNYIRYRNQNTSQVWYDWRTIAFTDSDITGNAATASALITSTYEYAMVNGNNVLFGYDTAKNNYDTLLAGRNVSLRYGTNPSIGFLLNSSGNVTIGPNDMAGTGTKLYVNGCLALGGLTQLDQPMIKFDYSGDYFDLTGNFVFGANSDSWSIFNESSYDTLFRVMKSGNVGIGTTNPLYKLHVTGDTYITGNLIVDGEISAGGAAEESTTASGGANIKTDTIATGLSSKTITHNLDTEDVVICIYEKNNITSKWDMILTDVRIDSANAITVTFGSATTVEHKVVIIGE